MKRALVEKSLSERILSIEYCFQLFHGDRAWSGWEMARQHMILSNDAAWTQWWPAVPFAADYVAPYFLVWNRILNTLTKALQNSGVELSQASISVQIDVGKRASSGATSTSSSKVSCDFSLLFYTYIEGSSNVIDIKLPNSPSILRCIHNSCIRKSNLMVTFLGVCSCPEIQSDGNI